MKRIITWVMAAIGLLLTGSTEAASAKAGSCEAKAKTVSLGSTTTVTLVNEYDPEDKTFYDSGCFYLAVTLSKRSSCTVWMETNENFDFSVYPREATDDEFDKDIYGPSADFDVAEEYTNGIASYLHGEDWDSEDPASWKYYIYVEGEIGSKVTIHVDSGITSLDPEGVERNPRKIKAVTEKEETVSSTLINDEYYLTADLKAGRKYFFRTMNGSASAPLSLEITEENDNFTSEVDPAYTNDVNNSASIVYPTEDGTYLFHVSSTNSIPFGFVYRQMPTRAIAAHDAWPLTDGVPRTFHPGRMVADERYYDNIVDEQLFKFDAKAGERWVVDAAGADRPVMMLVYNAKGEILVSNATKGDETYDVRAALAVESAGTYYVAVYDPELGPTDAIVCAETTIVAEKVSAQAGSPDEWDATDDTWEGANILAPLPEGMGKQNLHGPHLLNKYDWYDVFAIAGRKKITYAIDLAWADESRIDVTFKATVFTVSSNREKVLFEEVLVPGTDTLEYTPTANGLFYVRLEVAEGVGLDTPAYTVIPTASSTLGTLYSLTVNTKGYDGTWQLSGDSTKYPGGASVLVVGKQTVSFVAPSGSDLVKPANIVVEPKEGELEVERTGVYSDKFDPKDDTVAGAAKLSISAKEATAKRTFWEEDLVDNFVFTVKEGFYYNFALTDVVGDVEMAIYKKAKTGLGDCVVEPTAEIAAFTGEKGDYILAVTHKGGEPADASYSLTHSSVNVGAIKFKATSVKAAKAKGFVDLTVTRTSAEGAVRVRYGTVNDTAKPGVDYIAQNGELEWKAGDKTARTITIKLVPEALPEAALSRQFGVELRPVDKEELAKGEYLASITTPKAVVTVTEAKGRAPTPVKPATTKTEVAPLETGTFQGVLTTDSALTNGFPALASVTFTAKNAAKKALSAKVMVAGKTYTFSADTWAADQGDGKARAALVQVMKIGTRQVENVLNVTVTRGATATEGDWLMAAADVELTMNVPDANNKGFQEDIVYTGRLFRNNAKIQGYLDEVVGAAGYYTVALAPKDVSAKDGFPAGNGYLTMTLDAKGSARVAGKLADGTTAVSYTSFVAIEEIPDGEGTVKVLSVPVYLAKSPACFGGTICLVYRESDEAYVVDSSASTLVWNNDNALLTYDGEDGWQISIVPVGGYYNTVNNLQSYYLGGQFEIATADVTDLPEETLPEGYTFVPDVHPNDAAINLFGNAFSTAKKNLVKDGKLVDFEDERTVNPCNVQVKLARATGLVTGSFSLWSQDESGTVQKEVTGLAHAGVMLLSRDESTDVLPADVCSAGYFTRKMSLSYVDAAGRSKKRNWTASLPFNILAALPETEPDWYADDWGEKPSAE